MDLSVDYIPVAGGVTLIGGQPCPTPTSTQVCSGRDPRHPGPRLYTTSRPSALSDLTDNVRFSGLRLEGPHWNPAEGDDNLEHGIRIEGHTGIDISNMELAGWSGSAVKLTNESLPVQPRADAVRIHENLLICLTTPPA